MKYSEFKKQLELVPRIYALFQNEDLVINTSFELYMKKRLKPTKPHLKFNEAIIIKSVPFDQVKEFIFKDAVELVFAKEDYQCKKPKDIFNEAEKDLEPKDKTYLKYELGLEKYKDDIVKTMELIQNQIIGHLLSIVNVNDYKQALYSIGIKDVDNLIDTNTSYTD